MRSSEARIKIDDSQFVDITTTWGFHLVDADAVISPSYRDYESIQYPEESGERILPLTKKEPFDYRFTLAAIGNSDNVNESILDFYNKCFTQVGGNLRANKVIIQIDFYKIQIEGIIKSIEVYDFKETENKAFWTFEVTIRVSNPDNCIFNL